MWIIMPVLAAPEMTEAAIADCLAQTVPTRVLVINQGVESAFRERLERIAEEYENRIFLWSHDPPLLSLAASWNRALDFVWQQTGQTEALVINNDVRLHSATVELLSAAQKQTSALFVSCVGVTEGQFKADMPIPELRQAILDSTFGGPDFSCYLITRECHQKYRFDENFIPAYCEDLDYHRRLMLGGDGQKIFSVNLPYLHYAAGTLKTIDPKKKAAIEARIGSGSRVYYEKKWGGPVNQETFWRPFDDEGLPAALRKIPIDGFATCPGPTTPELQKWVQEHPV